MGGPLINASKNTTDSKKAEQLQMIKEFEEQKKKGTGKEEMGILWIVPNFPRLKNIKFK